MIYNKIIDFMLYSKYFIYFNIFFTVFLTNIFYYKITNNINKNLIFILYETINLNGCVLIKFIQWLTANLDMLEEKDMQHILKIFSNYYENCSQHNLNYTKKMFKNDFGYDFDDIITLDEHFDVKSASIAQVYKGKFKVDNQHSLFKKYNINWKNDNDNDNDIDIDIAIKVSHPNLEKQMYYSIKFLKFIIYLTENINFFKKYKTVFHFDKFIENLMQQKNMNNEYNNIKYFYEYYKDNEFIVIPRPLLYSENFLFMTFEDGERLESIDITHYEKQKFCTLLNLFHKNNAFICDYIHNDLHEANWKVRKYKDFGQIVIYDFGYIIKNNIKELSKKFIYYIDTNDFTNIMICICENSINKDELDFDFLIKEYNNNMDNLIPFSDETLKKTYKFCYNYNIKLNSILLEIFILNILLKKFFKDYIFIHEETDMLYNILLKQYNYYINVCEKYNIFQNLIPIFKEYYLENYIILNKHIYDDSNLNNIINDLDEEVISI
jgi:predicted unusual protein kinase regulating ubiquinone biosynthesis (AarF/ABC1/UbiB family)